jgi:hypothetical protein
MRWNRVRGTPPNVQTWTSEPNGSEIIQAGDASPGDEQLKHANAQIALASQYPGRERGLPSGAEVIKIDAGKRSSKT